MQGLKDCEPEACRSCSDWMSNWLLPFQESYRGWWPLEEFVLREVWGVCIHRASKLEEIIQVNLLGGTWQRPCRHFIWSRTSCRFNLSGPAELAARASVVWMESLVLLYFGYHATICLARWDYHRAWKHQWFWLADLITICCMAFSCRRRSVILVPCAHWINCSSWM